MLMCQSWSKEEEQERFGWGWGLQKEGCESRVAQERRQGGWVGRQAGGSGADVSRAEDELHAKTQSHRCLGYSLEQEGGGKENRNIIKLEAVLTHSPAGHHTVNTAEHT